MMKEDKIIKVKFEWKSGKIEYLEGKELKKWDDANVACAILAFNHFGKTGFEDVKRATKRANRGE